MNYIYNMHVGLISQVFALCIFTPGMWMKDISNRNIIKLMTSLIPTVGSVCASRHRYAKWIFCHVYYSMYYILFSIYCYIFHILYSLCMPRYFIFQGWSPGALLFLFFWHSRMKKLHEYDWFTVTSVNHTQLEVWSIAEQRLHSSCRYSVSILAQNPQK